MIFLFLNPRVSAYFLFIPIFLSTTSLGVSIIEVKRMPESDSSSKKNIENGQNYNDGHLFPENNFSGFLCIEKMATSGTAKSRCIG